ncbi:MAG: hypothetical protein QME47_08150, partial [Candidatus Thermoplasmatota archaeon]|nr:hypothetical protein [Candidatus Thermoplasmatota archaeon]
MVIRKLKKTAALKKLQNPLLIKDSRGFGGFAVLGFMLFVLGVSIGVTVATIQESYQYGPQYLTGEKDIGALESAHVTELYNLFLYIAFGFVGVAVAYLGFKYMWAAIKPEAVAQAKAVAPRLILAVCLLPIIGCLLKAVVWVNIEFIKVIVHQVGYGSVGALWDAMVWNTAGQHWWTIYIPLIIMGFVIAFIVALFVRWFL